MKLRQISNHTIDLAHDIVRRMPLGWLCGKEAYANEAEIDILKAVRDPISTRTYPIRSLIKETIRE